jgi:hypothetical protein
MPNFRFQRVPSTRWGTSSDLIAALVAILAIAGVFVAFLISDDFIGRSDKQGGSPVFLELNQALEKLSFTPIFSTIPNCGFAVDDTELFGLIYLQKITDTVTGGALRIEPGIWIHMPFALDK